MNRTTDAAEHHEAAPVDDPSRDERAELINQLQVVQDAFERRALSAWAEPLVTPSLTMQQLRVLTIIATDPAKATGQNLAALLRVSLASMSGIVDRLVDHGMVERTQDTDDRRVRRLSVTEEGAQVIQGLLSSAGAMPAAVLQRLALADLRALVRGVTAVDRVTQELAEGAG
jgi:DNA-binding MarR family transcriptional regulator